MKTIGILGGVGPETTSKVYHAIIDFFRKREKNYPSILIYNLPFPFVVEKEAIVEGKNVEKMIPYLTTGAKILEKGGADFGILPCNTLHKYIDEIRGSTNIPFLSIVDETVLELKSMECKTVGILATETTVNDKLYDNAIIENKMQPIYPAREEQDEINMIIIEILSGKKDNFQKDRIKDICLSLKKRGADAVLLACTDLQVITDNIDALIPIIDTTEVLIGASIKELLK